MTPTAVSVGIDAVRGARSRSVASTTIVQGDAGATALAFARPITWASVSTQGAVGTFSVASGALRYAPGAGFALWPLAGDTATDQGVAVDGEGKAWRVRVTVAGVAEGDATLIAGHFPVGFGSVGDRWSLAVNGSVGAGSPTLQLVQPMVSEPGIGDGTHHRLSAPYAGGEIISASATHPHGAPFISYSLATGGQFGALTLTPDLSGLDVSGGLHVIAALSTDGARAMVLVRDPSGAVAVVSGDASGQQIYAPRSVRFLGSAQSAADDPVTSYQTARGLAVFAHIDIINAATGAVAALWSDTTAGWGALKGVIPSDPVQMQTALLAALDGYLSPARLPMVVTDAAPIVFAGPGAATQSYALVGVPTPPVALGALPDLSLTVGEFMPPVDVAADFTGSGPMSFALAPSSVAPAWLTLTGGVLTGAPSGPVSVVIVIRATNAAGYADTAFQITVSAVAVDAASRLWFAGPQAVVVDTMDAEIDPNRGAIEVYNAADPLLGVTKRALYRDADPTQPVIYRFGARTPLHATDVFAAKDPLPNLAYDHAANPAQNFVAAAQTPAGWTVTVDGAPATVSAVHRHSFVCDKISTRAEGNWTGTTPELAQSEQYAFRHRLTLTLAAAVPAGALVSVTPPWSAGKPAVAAYAETTVSDAVMVAQTGYAPGQKKIATVSAWLGARDNAGAFAFLTSEDTLPATKRFRVVRTSDNAVVKGWTALVAEAAGASSINFSSVAHSSGARVWLADFSDVTAPGTYRVEVEGVGCSVPFPIAASVHRDLAAAVAKAMTYSRRMQDMNFAGSGWGQSVIRPRCAFPHVLMGSTRVTEGSEGPGSGVDKFELLNNGATKLRALTKGATTLFTTSAAKAWPENTAIRIADVAGATAMNGDWRLKRDQAALPNLAGLAAGYVVRAGSATIADNAGAVRVVYGATTTRITQTTPIPAGTYRLVATVADGTAGGAAADRLRVATTIAGDVAVAGVADMFTGSHDVTFTLTAPAYLALIATGAGTTDYTVSLKRLDGAATAWELRTTADAAVNSTGWGTYTLSGSSAGHVKPIFPEHCITAIAKDGGTGLWRITLAMPQDWQTGETIRLFNLRGAAGGAVELFNRSWVVNRIDATTFDLQGSSAVTLAAPYVTGSDGLYTGPSDDAGSKGRAGRQITPRYLWQDAADYDARPQHLALARWMVLLAVIFPRMGTLALGIPESGVAVSRPVKHLGTEGTRTYPVLPDLISEALWCIDGFRDLQAADGSVRGGPEVSRYNYKGGTGYAFGDDVAGWVYGPDPYATAEFGAAAALMAWSLRRLFPADANALARATEFEAAALAAHGWFTANLDMVAADGKNTDERLRKAVYAFRVNLWLMTGTVSYLEAHSARTGSTSYPDWAAGMSSLNGSGDAALALLWGHHAGVRTIPAGHNDVTYTSASNYTTRAVTLVTDLNVAGNYAEFMGMRRLNTGDGEFEEAFGQPYATADRLVFAAAIRPWLSGAQQTSVDPILADVAARELLYAAGANPAGFPTITGVGHRRASIGDDAWVGAGAHAPGMPLIGPAPKGLIQRDYEAWFWRGAERRQYPSNLWRDIPFAHNWSPGGTYSSQSEWTPHTGHMIHLAALAVMDWKWGA